MGYVEIFLQSGGEVVPVQMCLVNIIVEQNLLPVKRMKGGRFDLRHCKKVCRRKGPRYLCS